MANLDQLVEQLSGLTILEAAQLKTMLEEKWGVKAASGGGMMMMAAAAPAAAAAAEPVEEQTEFNVLLTGVGPKKINVIKVVRQITNLGLKEAKELVEGAENAPATVIEGVSKENAAEYKRLLEAEGATVSVK
ncbi:MAG: 50S ribosomal protein L7/L12 [Chloroflexi bacterium]|nr:50S ribosomal protein L7/L12 [Chloroflexota bacterium]